jgi:hypothetical protein
MQWVGPKLVAQIHASSNGPLGAGCGMRRFSVCAPTRPHATSVENSGVMSVRFRQPLGTLSDSQGNLEPA